MRTKLIATVVALLALAGLASAQGINLNGIQVEPFKAKYFSNYDAALDASPAIYIKYVGPGPAPTVANVSGTSITFQVNSVAYTGFECPVSGALGGVITVSDAACNTLGKVVDTINATAANFSTGYFRAVIANGLRSDSSAAFLSDTVDSDVATPEGEVLFWDSSNLDDSEIGAFDYSKGVQNWFSGNKLVKNPFADTDTVLLYGHVNIANAGARGTVTVYCVFENYLDGQAASSEVVKTVYLEAAGTTGVTNKLDEFLNAGGIHCQGGKMFVREDDSGADTTAQVLFLTGYKTVLAK